MDYYKNHEWYDNAMVIYEYPLAEGVARAFYQVQTTTSAGGGYFENVHGRRRHDQNVGESRHLPRFTAKPARPSWDDLIAKNYIRAKSRRHVADADAAKVDVRETAQLAEYEIPVSFNKPHQPHLENFFNAIRGTAKLNCPADEAFAQRIRHPQGERSHRRAKNACHHARGNRSLNLNFENRTTKSYIT